MARTGTVKAKSKVLTVGDEKGWPQQTFARRCGHTPLRLDNQAGGSQIAKEFDFACPPATCAWEKPQGHS